MIFVLCSGRLHFHLEEECRNVWEMFLQLMLRSCQPRLKTMTGLHVLLVLGG